MHYLLNMYFVASQDALDGYVFLCHPTNVPWVAMIRHAQVELSLIFQELRTQERSVMPM